jgi:hypothetical protein
MKTFKEIREKWDKEEEKAFANVLFWLAKKGTRGAIKTGRALVKGGKKTGDYLERTAMAILIPLAGKDELQALEQMGIDIPGFEKLMSPNQRKAWNKAYGIKDNVNEGLSSTDSVKISAALKDGKTVIGKSDRKDGSNKGKDFKILKLYIQTIGFTRVKKARVDWGTGPKPMDLSFITSYDISENEVLKKG